MKKRIAACLLMAVLTIAGCGQTPENHTGQVEQVDIESALLKKTITSFVYLPYAYDETSKYPVLYFMASAGGSAYTVINQFDIAATADTLIESGAIEPMIIVALGIDFSFGINSSGTTGTQTFESEQVYTFAEGPYEDYIVREAIPYIDAHYATRNERAFRYIGGYSMGGFVALHVGFRHPDMFSKIGGHSPTLFLDTYVTPEIDQWLFPSAEARAERDPMLLAETAALNGVEIYLDTGAADVNLDACRELARKLTERGVDASFLELSGVHGFAYCREHMREYLLFYGAAQTDAI